MNPVARATKKDGRKRKNEKVTVIKNQRNYSKKKEKKFKKKKKKSTKFKQLK